MAYLVVESGARYGWYPPGSVQAMLLLFSGRFRERRIFRLRAFSHNWSNLSSLLQWTVRIGSRVYAVTVPFRVCQGSMARPHYRYGYTNAWSVIACFNLHSLYCAESFWYSSGLDHIAQFVSQGPNRFFWKGEPFHTFRFTFLVIRLCTDLFTMWHSFMETLFWFSGWPGSIAKLK